MFPDAGCLLQEQNLQSHWRLPHVEQCTCFLFSVDRSWYNWCLSLSQLYKTLEEPFETFLRQISRLLPVKMHTYGRFKFLTSETMRCDRPGCPCSECQGSRRLSQPTRTWWRAEQEVKQIFQISNIMILQLAISTNSRSHIGIHLYIYISRRTQGNDSNSNYYSTFPGRPTIFHPPLTTYHLATTLLPTKPTPATHPPTYPVPTTQLKSTPTTHLPATTYHSPPTHQTHHPSHQKTTTLKPNLDLT